ncbi:MAG TPA: alpha/beta fold hydrolase [Saprospiraceae bacterium]|nr:alpha/beta fold hydrolase [Saprospiraceae bacterium]HMQ82059.1 alpha/beta fold hydrolase [Saprospiraceae bacterium]
MPYIEHSTYRAKGVFKNGHVNTIYASVFRPMPALQYQRERLTTPDLDFIDLDWSVVGSDSFALILHGLESSTERPYIKWMVQRFNQAGWDAAALNFRGCSGEPNRLLRSYHIGETDDTHFVLESILQQKDYRRVVLVGFSLGGNVVLKYLGENASRLPKALKAGVAFSVPCDIITANVEIHKWHNKLYLLNFMKSLNEKIAIKRSFFDDQMPMPQKRPSTFHEFDGHFTAPIHGFESAEHYWTANSCIHFLPRLARPALLVNALDDSFLSAPCYPYDVARTSSNLFLETPLSGGHVGFTTQLGKGAFWSEDRAIEFIQSVT